MMKLSTVAIAACLFASAGAVSAQGITDPQIASIVVTANQVDIDAGKLEVERSTNKDVKAFG